MEPLDLSPDLPAPDVPVVLVVDDEPFFRRLLADALEARGWATLAARNADEALRFFERAGTREAPVIVLLDLMLPGMNGVELLYGLARTVPRDRIRIVLCSAHHVLEKVAAAHPLVAARLAKPFAPEALAAAVETAGTALGAA